MVFDYSPAPVPGTAVDLRPVYGPFIGGEFRTSGGTAAVGNPATGAVLTEVVQADSADVDAAVDAASAALSGGWGSAPGRDRARHLYLLASLLAERSPELALLETLDSGTPIRQCRGTSLPLAAETCFYYAGWADKLRHARRQDAPDGAEPRPMGVVALLVADPVPLPTLIRKIAAALACG
ncbi:MAG: aldehyde dehydrogenase family protein, partial [Dactylosporangium sp.]|nr:aldehyde dehydrogenase family protein [Dactylosporangium sp.]NNJ63428.1 aldehyde dehydrogenase family protein [Dactylosporangium sp.]